MLNARFLHVVKMMVMMIAVIFNNFLLHSFNFIQERDGVSERNSKRSKCVHM